MPQSIVECIPNFSEARRPEVVAEIMAAISQESASAYWISTRILITIGL